MTAHSDLESIFQRALEYEDTRRRDSYLLEACGDDQSLRAEIDRLLRSHEIVAGSHVDSPDLRATELINRGTRNESVLGNFHDLLGDAPSVVLHELDAEPEPIQRPDSYEMPPAPQDGRYQLQGEIARGGMGVVIKGRDNDLGRDLAVKVLLESHRDKPEVTQRFIEEAQIGGQLQHPGIAPVYELGQFADQRPYFTMKLVKGKTLAALLAGRKSVDEDRSKFIGIFEQVCQTMAYAHSRGVIHRDLKPANIMVGAFGEVQVMDWGLAKVLSSGGVTDEKLAHQTHQDRSVIETLRSGGSDTPMEFGSQTQMGSVMGTPAYMAPEQALGEIDQLDQRADVFGLGAILCEVLTGKPPYVADDALQIYRMATRGKLEECFRRLDESGDTELTDLARQCLSSEPSDRPNDADALAEAISLYQNTVESRLRESEIDRARQTTKASEERKLRRVVSAFAAVTVLSVVTIAGGGFWLQAEKASAATEIAVAERQVANSAKQLADEEREAKEDMRWVLYRSDIQRAQAEIEHGRYSRAEEILARHIPEDGKRDLRGFEWRFLMQQCPRAEVLQPVQWEGDLPLKAQRIFSDDGSRFALVISKLGSQYLSVWSVKTGRIVWEQRLAVTVEKPQLALNQDGSLLGLSFVVRSTSTAKEDAATAEVHVWDVAKETRIARIGAKQISQLEEKPASIDFRPHSTSIVIGTQIHPTNQGDTSIRKSLHVWNWINAELDYKIDLDGRIVPSVFSRDGTLLALRGNDEVVPALSSEGWERSSATIEILDATNGKVIREIKAPRYRVPYEFSFSPDGKLLAVSLLENVLPADREFRNSDELTIYDLQTGSTTISVQTKYGFGKPLFSGDAKYIAVVSRTGSEASLPGAGQSRTAAEVFRVDDGAPVLRLEDVGIGKPSFSSKGRSLELLEQNGNVKRWPLAPRWQFDSGQYARSGHASASGNARLVLRTTGKKRSDAHDIDQEVAIFDTDGRKILSKRLPWADGWHHWKMNHDGSAALTERSSSTNAKVNSIYVWNLHGAEQPYQLSDKRDNVKQWIVSPAGAKAAGVVGRGSDTAPREELVVWDQESGETKRTQLTGSIYPQSKLRELLIRSAREGSPTQMRFSPCGKFIGIASYSMSNEQSDRTEMSLYESSTLARLKSLSIPGLFTCFEFSPNGMYVAGSVGHEFEEIDFEVEIWDLETKKIHSKVTQGGIPQLAFSPDNKRLLAIKMLWPPQVQKYSDQLTVWDVATGSRILDRVYHGRGGVGQKFFGFSPGEPRLLGLGYYGLPQFWDGRPMGSAIE